LSTQEPGILLGLMSMGGGGSDGGSEGTARSLTPDTPLAEDVHPWAWKIGDGGHGSRGR